MASRTSLDLRAEPGCRLVPAVYDALSARIAARGGFLAVGRGGFLVAASRLRGPDVGQLTMTKMADHLRGQFDAHFALVRLPDYTWLEHRDGE